MKNLKRYLNLGVGILILAFCLSAPAQAVVFPSQSVINPVNETVYVPDNHSKEGPGIRIYAKVDNDKAYWEHLENEFIELPAKCYGLAVWQSGSTGKLLVSINDDTGSKLRYYKLGAKGLPTSGPKDISISEIGSSPTGLVIASTDSENPSGDRAYLADAGTGRVYHFNYDPVNDRWVPANVQNDFAKDTFFETDYHAYGITVTPAKNTYTMTWDPVKGWVRTVNSATYYIFVSTKTLPGKIQVFKYTWTKGGTEEIKHSGSIPPAIGDDIERLQYPTFMQVNAAGTKLYVAVNGASDGDIKTYAIGSASPVLKPEATISSGINAELGWTDFDLSADEKYLFFTQKTPKGTTLIMKADIVKGGSPDKVAELETEVDGLLSNINFTVLGATYSTDGSLIEVETGFGNHTPADPANLKQYKKDGTTEILKTGTYPVNPGLTNENQIVAKFAVSDPDGGSLTPLVRYHKKDSSGNYPSTWTQVTGSIVQSGSTASITLPPASTFSDGEYEWEAAVKDPVGSQSSWVRFYGDAGLTDFIVDTKGPYATITYPADNEVIKDTQTILATIDDSSTGNLKIVEAEYYVDSGTPKSMSAVDGSFNSATEDVEVNLDTTTLSDGQHTIYVRGKDEAGNWGPSASIKVEVNNDPPVITTFKVEAGDEQCTVTWDNPADADLSKVIIVRNTGDWPAINDQGTPTKGQIVVTQNTPGAGSQSFTDDNPPLQNNTTYYYAGFTLDTALNWNIEVDSSTTDGDGINADSGTPQDSRSPVASITYPTNNATISGDITLQAQIDDSSTGKSNIFQAEYRIDSGTTQSMQPNDGSFNSVTELVYATIKTTDLSEGTHLIEVRGQDAAGYWSAYASVTVTVDNIPDDTTGPISTFTDLTSGDVIQGSAYQLQATIDDSTTGNSNIAAAEYFINSPNFPTPGTGTPMQAADGSFNTPTENAVATLDTTQAPFVEGQKNTIYVCGQDAQGNWGQVVQVTVTVDNVADDTTSPEAITDLVAGVGTDPGEVDLTWTAPHDDGDDPTSGPASSYTIYYQFTDQEPTDTSGASEYTNTTVPTPGAPSTTENFTLDFPNDKGKLIWVMITADDEVPNTSADGNWSATIVKNNVNAPVITKVYPRKGPNDREHDIVIIGENLWNPLLASIVSYDGSVTVPLTNVVMHGAGDFVEATIPKSSPIPIPAGSYEVTITAPGGTYDDSVHNNPDNDFEIIAQNSDTTAPALVADFKASDNEDSQSTLTWTNPADVDLREILVLRNTGTWPSIDSSGNITAGIKVEGASSVIPEPGTSESYVDTGLTNGTPYYYAVFSRDTSDNWNSTLTDGSNADTGTPGLGDNISPEAITDLVAGVGSNYGEVDLTWTAPADDGSDPASGKVTSYTIHYKDSETGPVSAYPSAPSPQDPGSQETYTLDLDAKAGNKIWVMVTADDEVPNTSPDGNWAVTIVKNNLNPPVITKVYPRKGPNDREHDIVIIGENLWNPMVGSIVSYDGSITVPLINPITHSGDGTFAEAKIPKSSPIPIPAGSYEVTITAPGGTYDDSVHNNPDNDFEIIAQNSDTTAPALVADFKASDNEDSQSTLTWTNPADVDLREILVLRNTGTWPSIDSSGNITAGTKVEGASSVIPEPGTSESYVDTGLTNGDTYYYAVFSRDTSDNWNSTLTNGSNADTATPNIPGNDPVLDLTVLMQGFYDGTSQVITGVSIEARDTLTNVVGAWYDDLDSNGNAQIDLTGLADGDYYIVVRHDLPNTAPGPNHLAIMTATTKSFSAGSTTAINLSDPISTDYVAAYNPDPADPATYPDPMIDGPSGMKVMRGGDANGDGVVAIPDFGIFGAANGATPASPNWDERADFDGNGVVAIPDFGIFGQNNGRSSYVPTP